jgi:hypothetical protein
MDTIAPLTDSDLFDIDDLTANIMDEIRVVLKKYESNFPNWNDEDFTYNLDDSIYADVYDKILAHKLDTAKTK